MIEAPRYKIALDLLVKPEPSNARKIIKALKVFGFGSVDQREEDFCTPGQVIQLGVAPVRVDIMTSVTGVSWEDVWASSVR
ncbi:MAG: hypothetical protein QHH07_11340 [Sedimentisphaerales bacterium]|nr:hypothetical protein [Sedimentisphaerales bacterium]